MTTSFQIGGIPVGEGYPIYVIAELPIGPHLTREVAARTIEAAAKLGASAVKIETCSDRRSTAGMTGKPENADAIAPWEWHADLAACAAGAGIALISAPLDAAAAELVEQLDVAAYGISSFDLVDLPLVEHLARRGRPLLLSTGMATLGEIEAAIATCRGAGNDRLALLRSALPAPAKPEHLNVRGHEALRAFGTVIGVSDRTIGGADAISSVALGAKIIEKRFVLDRARGGPGAASALEPAELEMMIKNVREVERVLDAPRFGVTEDDRGAFQFRRSLYVVRDVGVSAVLTADDVRAVRATFGIAPNYLPAVLGRRATRAIMTGTPITWDMVGPAPDRPGLELRPATADDHGALLAWRNEPRRGRGSEQPIGAEEHREWLARSLKRADRAIFLAWQGVTRVGTVRLDRDASAWEVTIGIAPEARGKRLATSMLVELEPVARAQGVRTLTARMRPDNVPCLAAFKRAGYYAWVERVIDGEKWLLCERRIVPFGR